ncbi:phospho-N-acetylmuramoyl-pentapeptide-transferase [uncultured Fretibacterium sp.]|uniref:phospho-N-acetylmuramoyl-pentapeptide- transferase n=1 Tax=uncultured Fretibacterium sp. TaxID=1678694 RepID=UPI00325FD1C5
MMEIAVWGGGFFLLGLLLQHVWIGVQRRWSVGQAQKSYGVGIDVEIKAATPPMGGCVFLFMALLALLATWGSEALVFWSLPIAGGAIGLVDDGMKFFRKSSEGFRSLAKLKVQLVVCGAWALVVHLRGGLALWSGIPGPVWLVFPLAVLGVSGMMNAVNITDGLDGLAGGCFLIALGALAFLLPSDGSGFNALAMVLLFAMASSFLFYNLHPARTFMGDTGAHFLGGALAALCVMNGRLLALIPVGFLFGVELLSSAVQIFTIRKLNRRVLLMAPLHHHFQRLGWDETSVTMRFWLVQAVGSLWLSALFTALFGR